MDKRIVVAVDGWEVDSMYPHGHYIRTLGTIGDKDTETVGGWGRGVGGRVVLCGGRGGGGRGLGRGGGLLCVPWCAVLWGKWERRGKGGMTGE